MSAEVGSWSNDPSTKCSSAFGNPPDEDPDPIDVDILVPAPEGGYQLTTGTSVAAAHISGVVALMLERNPRLTPAEVRAILSATAKKLPQGRNEIGAGLVYGELPAGCFVALDWYHSFEIDGSYVEASVGGEWDWRDSSGRPLSWQVAHAPA